MARGPCSPLRGRPVHMASADSPHRTLWARPGGGEQSSVDVLASGEAGAVSNYPVGVPIPLMDPVNLPVYRAFSWVHPALGYNAVWCFNLVLAYSGAAFLARVMGVSSSASVVAGVACAFSPFLSGLGSFGITESWGIGWLGLHCAFLLRYGEDRRDADLVFAALSLAAFLWTGWYSAVFALVAECCVGLTLMRRRQLGLGVLVQGGIASLLVLPGLLRFWSERSFWSGRWEECLHRWMGNGRPGESFLDRGLICSTWSFRVSRRLRCQNRCTWVSL